MVHGIGEHSGRHVHVGSHLAAAGFDVLAFDNRGFGQSGGRRGHVDSFEEYLDDLDDVLAKQRSLGVPLVLIGHSLGGLIVATYLTTDRPQPDLAVLSAPALAAQVPRWQRIVVPLLSRIRPTLFVKSSIDASMLSRDVRVQQAYLDDPLVVFGATGRLGDEIFRRMPITVAALGRATIPVHVIHGEADALVPVAASDPVASLPNADRRIWPGLRHECFNEPEQVQVLEELTDWLVGQLAASATS